MAFPPFLNVPRVVEEERIAMVTTGGNQDNAASTCMGTQVHDLLM